MLGFASKENHIRTQLMHTIVSLKLQLSFFPFWLNKEKRAKRNKNFRLGFLRSRSLQYLLRDEVYYLPTALLKNWFHGMPVARIIGQFCEEPPQCGTFIYPPEEEKPLSNLRKEQIS